MRINDMDVARSGATSGHRWVRASGYSAGLLLLLASAASGQPSGAAGASRAAVLLPPRAAPAEREPIVARGAMDAPLTPLDRTPVRRSEKPASESSSVTGPAWLRGVDPGVVVAGGSSPVVSGRASSPITGRAVVPASEAADPSLVDRGWEKLKAFSAAEPAVPFGGTSRTKAPAEPPPAGPHTPLQGSSPNGSPVYAGPPAWRWYGYGTVTPGANSYAPAGEYPMASANWYSVTQATPGAFPVPVMSPYRPAPGSEPPAYVPTRTSAPTGVAGTGSLSVNTARPQMTGLPSPPLASQASKFSTVTDMRPAAGIPTMAAPPAVVPPPAAAAAATPLPVQPAAIPPIPPLQPIAVRSAEPVEPALPSRPLEPASPLAPAAVDTAQWQSAPAPPQPISPAPWQPSPNGR